MANLSAIAKTVTLAATPEALGAAAQKFNAVTFIAYKGTSETANTGDVHIQLPAMDTDGSEGSLVSCIKLTAGSASPRLCVGPGAKAISADKVTVKVATDGDGVVAIVEH